MGVTSLEQGHPYSTSGEASTCRTGFLCMVALFVRLNLLHVPNGSHTSFNHDSDEVE